ncbi:hypothetical protein PV779_64810 [Streptomyces sp. ID01-9D]|nr:hypothetical protein [Streptomyces sp. ID01-9D]
MKFFLTWVLPLILTWSACWIMDSYDVEFWYELAVVMLISASSASGRIADEFY